MTTSFYYVYILLSLKDGKFYIGSTNNLRRRLTQHQQGKNISTTRRLPVNLIFYESFPTKTDALRRERYFKTTKGKITLRQMLQDYLRQGSSVGYLPALSADRQTAGRERGTFTPPQLTSRMII